MEAHDSEDSLLSPITAAAAADRSRWFRTNNYFAKLVSEGSGLPRRVLQQAFEDDARPAPSLPGPVPVTRESLRTSAVTAVPMTLQVTVPADP
jgi:hypothetical protein